MSSSAKIAAAAAAAMLLLPVLLAAATGGALSAVFGSSSTPSQAAQADIPADYLALYQWAASVCPGLDWTVLAAIGKIESDHGRSTLPGIADGTENSARARGPMQFLQRTFDAVTTRHTIPPGGKIPPSPWDKHDAIFAASFYLCQNNASRDLRAAIFAYNQAHWYVAKVLAQADAYRGVPAPERPGELRLNWPPEQATMPDPTSNGRITPRTYTLVRALQASGMTGNGIGCFAPRPANPASDHPKGKACDVMFNPHDNAQVAEGWRLASWLIDHQATYGVHYIIWQGKFWSAYDPKWVPYRSSNYGCPNPVNLTGCHYDHVHWSVL